MKLTKKELLQYAKNELDTVGLNETEIKETINTILLNLFDTATEYLKEDLEELKNSKGVTK